VFHQGRYKFKSSKSHEEEGMPFLLHENSLFVALNLATLTACAVLEQKDTQTSGDYAVHYYGPLVTDSSLENLKAKLSKRLGKEDNIGLENARQSWTILAGEIGNENRNYRFQSAGFK
jgi:hypothetical protein